MTSALDASALLAYLQGEAGAEPVAAALSEGAAISVVNLADVLSKLAEQGQAPEAVLEKLRVADLFDALLTVQPLTEQDAVQAATWRLPTKVLGLSLGDRCCLALAHRLGLPAITADRDWQRAGLPVAVALIR